MKAGLSLNVFWQGTSKPLLRVHLSSFVFISHLLYLPGQQPKNFVMQASISRTSATDRVSCFQSCNEHCYLWSHPWVGSLNGFGCGTVILPSWAKVTNLSKWNIGGQCMISYNHHQMCLYKHCSITYFTRKSSNSISISVHCSMTRNSAAEFQTGRYSGLHWYTKFKIALGFVTWCLGFWKAIKLHGELYPKGSQYHIL